ncbi:uncharacterized protein LOC114526526 [Dendronephthya gigantea]|uniref:uncharacterized protein LOC114526526 n=1 Tax=Dendronephthya gigantea TaxID=151771 RepID=UPI00106A0716|nr:uncharacterized protein LOC114526526 [Dendronephthya gigantea]
MTIFPRHKSLSVLPKRIRVDKGTETGKMATIHCYLQEKVGNEDAIETVLYGPSTQNKIERWWQELLERMERFFKDQLKELVENGDYDPSSENDRSMLAYIYIPVVQKELNTFKETVWNNHRGRKQRNKALPDGIPNHIYAFPEQYGGVKCGIPIEVEDLQEVADVSNILDGTGDYLEPEFCAKCERIFPEVNEIAPSEASDAFLTLKQNFDESRIQPNSSASNF